ncbi:MAG: hypothetical protein J0I06_17605, partial [Planctomycetes bacterium]|nr:hypothetical protein [Planctomycetota bacterium]
GPPDSKWIVTTWPYRVPVYLECWLFSGFIIYALMAAADLKGAEVGWVVPRYVDPAGEVGVGPYGEVFGMWVGLRANVPVLNGYSGRPPKGFPPMGALSDDQIREWLKGKFRGTVRVIDSEAPGQRRDVVVE